MGLLLRKNHLLRHWDCYSLLNWIGAIRSSVLLKLTHLKVFSPERAPYLYKSTIQPYMEFCCHVWAGAPSY